MSSFRPPLKRKNVSFSEGDVSVRPDFLPESSAPSDYFSLKTLMKQDLHNILFVFLKSRPRSIWECQKKLELHQFLPQEIEDELDFFQEKGWLNDTQFAKLLLEGTQSHRALGYRGIRDKLREKRISPQIIDKILEQHRENFATDGEKLLEKQQYRFDKYEGWKRREKIVSYLYQRGFSQDEIDKILEKSKKN